MTNLLGPLPADAVPKKRGPKTDVLEALLKRVDGLEAKLKEKNAGEKTPTTPTSAGIKEEEASRAEDDTEEDSNPKRLALDTSKIDVDESAVYSPAPARYVAITRTCRTENSLLQ